MDEDPVNRNETEDIQISIGGGDGKYTSVTIGEQKFQLLERELISLQKCVNTTVGSYLSW